MYSHDELQLWCNVSWINKDKVYRLRFESNKAIERHSYQESSSSSSVHIMREEFEQLRNKLKDAKKDYPSKNPK